jgi:hypothetical protein
LKSLPLAKWVPDTFYFDRITGATFSRYATTSLVYGPSSALIYGFKPVLLYSILRANDNIAANSVRTYKPVE